MTKAEKYPNSVEAELQREAKRIVVSVWNMCLNRNCHDYNLEVQIMPGIYNALNTRQKNYFYNLFGGVWNIIMPNDRLGVWLSVPREYIHCFHYRTPQRVRPIRVYK